MCYCDLCVNLSDGNYREVLDYLMKKGYKYIGYPINKLEREDIKKIEAYARELGLFALKRVNLKGKYEVRGNVLYAADIAYVKPKNLNRILKITPIIYIPDIEKVSIEILKQLIRIKKLVFEVNYVNLLYSIYRRYVNKQSLPKVINYLKVLIESSRLVVSSGASNKEHILTPKEVILSILGLFNINYYTESFLKTLPYHIISEYFNLV